MIKFNCCETSAPARAKTISVYEAIGGPAAVVAIVDSFHRRLLAGAALGELGIARELTDRIAAVVAGPRPAVAGVVSGRGVPGDLAG